MSHLESENNNLIEKEKKNYIKTKIYEAQLKLIIDKPSNSYEKINKLQFENEKFNNLIEFFNNIVQNKPFCFQEKSTATFFNEQVFFISQSFNYRF